ncbi:MAG: glycine cleavage system aminomethyltransferase GcvT [Actinomycetota bacterium]
MGLRSPLFEEHQRLGARIVDFAGWDMPLQYSGVISEHLSVRHAVGIFDVSHLGKLTVEGERAVEDLDALLPGKVKGLGEMTAGYNLLLDERGGIVDDVFVYRRPEHLLVVPNAANTEAVLAAIREAAASSVEDSRETWAILAVQGPRSKDLLDRLRPEANRLRLHAFADFELGGATVQVARTGYTGEYGFELFVPSDDAPRTWRLLLETGEDLGIRPAGLGARDTLRLEMGYPLHGNDISLETNPVEAGLTWVIDWEKHSFRGKDALQQVRTKGPSRRLAGLVASGRGIPRPHYAVTRAGRTVGEVTSGNYSPVLERGIGLAYVGIEEARAGTMLSVDVRGKELPVEVKKPPFIRG